MGQDVADTARPRRRWLRFSLRGLLVLTLLLAVPLAWKANQVATERRNEAYLRQAGADIERSAPWGPAWLAALVGSDWLSHVESVRMGPAAIDIFNDGLVRPAPPATTDEHLAAIAALPHVREVAIRGSQMTSQGLRRLARLPDLTLLELYGGDLDEQGWKALAELRGLLALDVITGSSQGWQAVLELQQLKWLNVTCYRGDRPDLDQVESAVRAGMTELGYLSVTIEDTKIFWRPDEGPIRQAGRLIGFPREAR